MALQTKTFTAGGTSATKYYSIKLKLTEESTSVANNTSVVSYEFSISRQNSGVFTGPYYDWDISIGGTTIAIRDFAFNIPTSGASTQVIMAGKITVSHKADGTLNMPFNVWTPSAQDVAPTFGPPEIRLTGSWELTTIPRASSVSAVNADIGSSTVITISRASSAFTHTLTYEFGSLTGTIVTKTQDTSIPWTVPTAFYEQISDSKYGTVTLTCKTYSGSTLLGSKTTTFRATAAESQCKPTVTGTVVVTDELSKTLTGSSSKVIRYISEVRATISATAKNSATIVKRTINGVSLTNTLDLANISTGQFVFQATDSRGYTQSYTLDLTKSGNFVDYIPVTLTSLVSRVTPTGDLVTLDLKGSFWEGNFGVAENSLELFYQYKTSDQDWTTLTPILGPTISDNGYSIKFEVPEINYRKAYTFRIVVQDSAASLTQDKNLSQGIPIYDFGEEDFRLNVLLQAIEAIFSGTVTLSKTTDASGTADNGPALIVGGTRDTSHMEVDANEILAKSDGTTPAQLNLNTNGGLVAVGSGGLQPANLTASRVVVSDASKKLVSSAVTTTELGYLDGVTSNIQTQLNGKLSGSSAFAKLIYGGTISQNGTKTVDCGFTPQFCTYFMSSANNAAPWVGGAINFGKNGQEFRIYTSGSAYQRFTCSRRGNNVTIKKTGSDTVTLYLYAHR